MLKTYLAELLPDVSVKLTPIESKSYFIPSNTAQTMLLAHFWAECSPAGQVEFFTLGKILDLAPILAKDTSWTSYFCVSDRPGRAVIDWDDELDEITDPEEAARMVLFGLTDVRAIIYTHEEEIRKMYNT